MSDFTLDREQVKYAELNPYPGCYSPRRAAYGRVAESSIVEIAVRNLGLRVLSFNSEELPEKHKEILGKDKRHDGLLLEGCEFIGVIEAKLALRNIVLIQNEKSIYEYCRDHKLAYVVALAEMSNTRNLECSYMGSFNLCEHADVLSGVEISVELAKKYLIK